MKLRRWLTYLITLILPVALLLMGATASKQHRVRTCTGVRVSIDYGNAQPLLTRGMVTGIIGNVYDSLPGRPLGALDPEWFKFELEQIPYVRNASVRTDPSGNVTFVIRQRKPIARVINAGNQSFFIADDGMIMPSHTAVGAVLPVITTHFVMAGRRDVLDGTFIDSLAGGHVMHQAFELATELAGRPFMCDLIEQADIDPAGNMVLVPLIGPRKIYFGSGWKSDIKLRNIEAFYRQTSGNIDWSLYKAIDARFTNQIVCIKAE